MHLFLLKSWKMHVTFAFLQWLEISPSLLDISKMTENGLAKGATSAAVQQIEQNYQIVSGNPRLNLIYGWPFSS